MKRGNGRRTPPGGARALLYAALVAKHQPEFLQRAAPWVRDGSLRCREDIVEGLENAPEAFIGMLEGQNFGKLLVRV
jgi:NADPH-dependent curcumin reductase CurA